MAQLQAERDALELRAATLATELEAATRELDQARSDLDSKLKQQQNEFRALEEEQYRDWEKRVMTQYSSHLHNMSAGAAALHPTAAHYVMEPATNVCLARSAARLLLNMMVQ